MLNKAYLLTEDVRNASIDDKGMYQLASNSCHLVQSMNYSMRRCRQENGTPYNTSNMVILEVTVQQSEHTSFQVFYNCLKESQSHIFSMLFDASLESGSKLKDYGSAMVFSGYVVDIEETFHGGLTSLVPGATDELMQITVKIMLDHITYVGQTNDVNLTFYNNF